MIDSCWGDRQQYITTIRPGCTVRCACHDAKLKGEAEPQDCDRFTIYDGSQKPIHVMVGKQYRCFQGEGGEITVYSERANLISDSERAHTWETPIRQRSHSTCEL
jgi:hypothetical protein